MYFFFQLTLFAVSVGQLPLALIWMETTMLICSHLYRAIMQSMPTHSALHTGIDLNELNKEQRTCPYI